MSRWTASLVLLVSLGLPACGQAGRDEAATATALDASAARGRRIYLRGENAGPEPIVAVLEEQRVEVPATALACASCHGRDGKGRPEGGVVPASLLWRTLTRSTTRADGGRRPAYDERSLLRAITLGVDASGEKLHSVMPRYRLSHADARDLLAYLRQLGHDLDPGLGPDRIRLATLVTQGTDGPGEAIRALLEARLDQVNRAGGIYGRQLELTTLSLPARAPDRIEQLEEALRIDPAFALLAPSLGDQAAQAAALAERWEIPLLTPFVRRPASAASDDRYLFYLYSGALEQSRVLVELAARNPGPRTVIVYPPEEHAGPRLRAVVDQAKRSGLAAELLELTPAGGQPPWAPDTERLLVVGGSTFAEQLLRTAARTGWRGEIWLPGDDTGALQQTAPSAFGGTLLVALPTLPELDHQPRGIETWQALATEYHLTDHHRALQYAALATAELLLEALRRAGHDLNRETLIQALEELPPSSLALTPTLHFGPNRRTGALGGYVVRIDPRSGETERISGWIEPQ